MILKLKKANFIIHSIGPLVKVLEHCFILKKLSSQSVMTQNNKCIQVNRSKVLLHV